MYTLSHKLKKIAYGMGEEAWIDDIKSNYGIDLELKPDVTRRGSVARQIKLILDMFPPGLVKICGVKTLIVKWMGENKSFYPNHGAYDPSNQSVILNSDIFYHPDIPDDFMDENYHYINRQTQTLFHEFFHAFDAYHGDLSLKSDWVSLSGWSEKFKPGLKRLVISDPGTPKVIGEMYFDPNSGFARFYSKRNSWDDFADSASFYLANLKTKLPNNKIKYMDKLLGKYFS